MRGQYTRLVTPELAERVHEYLLKNRERFRLYGKDVLKVNTKRIRKELGLKPQLIRHLFNYMELAGMVKVVASRRCHNGAIYFIELREQVPVKAGPIGKSHR